MLRPLMAAAALLVVGVALALVVVPRLTARPRGVELDPISDVNPTLPAAHAQVGAPVDRRHPPPREAIGEGDDVTEMPPGDFEELRFTVTEMDDASFVRGSDVRDSILARPGTYLRYRSEADKKAFLAARMAIPLEAGRPKGDAPGTRLETISRAIADAGFEMLYRLPLIRIGARQAGSADGPR